ncbi:hypothetical protein FRC10_002681 [Ceratobasidium sp. 414]|nr:hypothetical protein FRC10_002681 [Ceratobasidium sp. 414]
MADAGFFKGTSIDQDRRFADKENRLMKSLTFPPEFNQKVDMRKVNLQVMRPWITKKVVELVGFEDEVVVEYAMGLLEDQSKPIDPKLMQINLTGFLEAKTPAFMSALWALLLDAQKSPAGVPSSFVQEKKEELRLKHEADERALAEARRRGEHDLRLDENDAATEEGEVAIAVIAAGVQTLSAADRAMLVGVIVGAGAQETAVHLVAGRRLEVGVGPAHQSLVGGGIDVHLRQDGRLLLEGGAGLHPQQGDVGLLHVDTRDLEEVGGRLHHAVGTDVHRLRHAEVDARPLQEAQDDPPLRHDEGAPRFAARHRRVAQQNAQQGGAPHLLKMFRLVLGCLGQSRPRDHDRGQGLGLPHDAAAHPPDAETPAVRALPPRRLPARHRRQGGNVAARAAAVRVANERMGKMQPLTIRGAAAASAAGAGTGKKGRWEGDDEKAANARIESELRENLLRQKVMKTRKGRRGSEAE